MASSSRLARGLSPSEAAFLCEMELVTVVPRQRLDSLDLIGGPTPPLIPPHRSTLPLWLAILLRRQNRANIVPPAWMEPEALQSILDIETDGASSHGAPLPGGAQSSAASFFGDSSSGPTLGGVTSTQQTGVAPGSGPVVAPPQSGFSAAPKLHTLSATLTRGNEAFSTTVVTNPAILSPPFVPSSLASSTTRSENPYSSTVLNAFRNKPSKGRRGGRGDGDDESGGFGGRSSSGSTAVPRLPYHWLEMATLLLAHASEDFSDPDLVRRMIRDLREVRQAKTRAGIEELDGYEGVRMNGIGAMELVEMRGVIERVVDGLRKVRVRREGDGGEGEDEEAAEGAYYLERNGRRGPSGTGGGQNYSQGSGGPTRRGGGGGRASGFGREGTGESGSAYGAIRQRRDLDDDDDDNLL